MVISEYIPNSISNPTVAIPWPIEKRKINFQPVPKDMTVQCPHCKTIETLQFVQNRMLPSSKFKQVDGKIFHTCGSVLPCKIYR
jgi:hypothetical protein